MTQTNGHIDKELKANETKGVPNGWQKVKLSHVAEVQTGVQKGAKKKENEEFVELPYLRVANVQDGHVDLSEVKSISVPSSKVERYSLKEGDVLMTEGGDFDKLGRGTIWKGQIEPCLHQNHVFVVRPNSDKLTPYYLNAYSSSEKGKNYFIACSKQSTNLASINSSQLKGFPIPLPPLPEQKAIARVLSTWDAGIQKMQELLDLKTQKQKALMQQLLTGKKRFAGFEEDWREVKLNDLFERVTRKNTEGNTNVATISAQRGLVRQDSFFKKNVASATLDNYFLLERDEFAYNKSYSNGYPMGAIKRLKLYDKAVVTTLYICFEVKEGAPADRDYFEHFFEGGRLVQGLMKIAHEGGRAHGLLNVTPSDFFNLKVTVPPLPEQRKIASVLNAGEQELAVLRQKLEGLKTHKKGLMQQLLTGKVRVKIK